MLNKIKLFFVVFFLIFCCNCSTSKNKNIINSNGYKIVNNKNIIKKYNEIFSKLIPFNFEIKNDKLKYYKLVFNNKKNTFEKEFKKINFIKYVEKYYNSEKDFNIWLIIYFKNIDSYHYYNIYTNKNEIIVNEYVNNVNNKDYFDYIFDEYKYNINSYTKNIDVLEKPINNININQENKKLNTILDSSLIKNKNKIDVFGNNNFFIVFNDNNSTLFLWKNKMDITENPNIIAKNCKTFISGSAHNIDYFCFDNRYIYELSINRVSHPNVPFYELSIYQSNSKQDIDKFKDDHYYDFLRKLKEILLPQELSKININNN